MIWMKILLDLDLCLELCIFHSDILKKKNTQKQRNNQKEKNLVITLKTWQQEKGFHHFFYGRGQTHPEIHFEMIGSDAQKFHCHKIPCSNLV